MLFIFKNDNGFIKYCKYFVINELECLSEFCKLKYLFCFKENCLSLCLEYIVSYNGFCLMDCLKELLYLMVICDGVCYIGVKFCFKICLSFYLYIFSFLKFWYCLVECLDYIVLDKRFCRFFCLVDYFFFFGKICLEKCLDIYLMIVF